MRLVILGCNGPYPAPGGATSGYLLSSGGTRLVMDLGSGCLERLTALMEPADLSAIVLSHWHYDHCCDLLPLSYRLGALGRRLTLYAPDDPDQPVARACQLSGVFDLRLFEPGADLCVGDIRIRTAPARHPVKAAMLRAEAEGKALVYTGDTNTVDGLADFARSADLLLADGPLTEQGWSEGRPHLSGTLAARYAVEAGAKRLMLTHLIPTVDQATLLREARAVRPDTVLAERGLALEL